MMLGALPIGNMDIKKSLLTNHIRDCSIKEGSLWSVQKLIEKLCHYTTMVDPFQQYGLDY